MTQRHKQPLTQGDFFNAKNLGTIIPVSLPDYTTTPDKWHEKISGSLDLLKNDFLLDDRSHTS